MIQNMMLYQHLQLIVMFNQVAKKVCVCVWGVCLGGKPLPISTPLAQSQYWAQHYHDQ